jgi:hypothetical protein
MNRKLTTALIALTLVGASAARAADDIVVQAARPAAHQSLDQRAAGACVEAFIAKILPGRTAVRIVIPDSGSSILNNPLGLNMLGVKMDVTMTATSARDNAELARASCTVDRAARVQSLSTHVINPLRLAGLTLKDMRLGMVSR